MEHYEKDLLVSRIITGFFRCKIDKKVYLLKQPNRHIRHISQEIFLESFKEAELEGLYTQKELDFFMYSNKVWDDEREDLLKKIPKDIEELKVVLYRAGFDIEQKIAIRKVLAVAKDKLSTLQKEKNLYNHLSCEGIASMNKMRYLVGKGLYHENGKIVWDRDDFWKQTEPLLEDATSLSIENRIYDFEFREMARTDPWRSIWSCRKSENSLFGVPAVDLTDDQKNIIVWSSLYDNIYEHPEAPPQAIIDEDDALDGWLIVQRRKRDKSNAQTEIDQVLGNEKIRNSKEVFIVAKNKKDIDKINSLNDDGVKFIKKERAEALKKHGELREQDMPDTKREIQMQANRG